MKIQSKLSLGLGFLFTLIVLLASVSLYYINSFTDASRSILEANYNSLEYVRNMYDAMDQDASMGVDTSRFRRYLEQQKKNITEIGEREVTSQLERDFTKSMGLQGQERAAVLSSIRHNLQLVMTLNMQALERKSIIARKTGDVAFELISGTATLCILLALVMFLNLPRTISKPIKELLNGIQQISAKNYNSRLHMDRRDEFRDIANSFNLLAVQLGEYYSSSMSRILVEKKRVEALVNNMHDPVIILDEQRAIIFVNDMACRILAMSREKLVGHSAPEIALTNDLMRSLLQDAKSMPQDGTTQNASIKIFADDKESYFEKEQQAIYVPEVGTETQQYLGDVIVLRNITSFKEYDFAKSSFIATVSHELKTPISSIKMSLQLLEKPESGTLSTEQHQLVESIADDCTRLLKISSELLNLSQSETGNIKLNVLPTDSSSIVRYALEATKILAEQRHIEFHIEHDPAVPKVLADAEKVTWVLINFLTNAIRYSPEQSRVQVRVAKSIKDPNTIEFSVSDQGKGIDARYREKIFDRYFQVPGSNKNGSGLGLAISKEFIEAQHGSIGVESEIGYGSRFWFCLHAQVDS